MPLIAHPTIADTLLSVGGTALAGSTDCCCGACECCEEVTCGVDTVHLPACGTFPVRYIGFTADFNITPCGGNICIACGAPHDAVGLGNNSNITRTDKKLACASTAPEDIAIPDPADLCVSASRCRVWQSCALPTDTITGLQIARYTDLNVFTCTGNFTLYTTATYVINLAYDHTNLRFILAIWLTPIGVHGGFAAGLLFLGTHAFDASSLSAYSAFPLTFTNGISSCSCLCVEPDYSSIPTRGYATGGTVTRRLYDTCEEECPTSLAGMSSEQLRGDADGAARLIARANASSSLAPAKQGCCV